MPYISTEEVKQIRQEIKETLKRNNIKAKISVTRPEARLVVTVLEADFDISEKYIELNHYTYQRRYADNPKLVRLFDLIDAAREITVPAFIQHECSDYGSIPNYYIDYNIGRSDKPYKKIA